MLTSSDVAEIFADPVTIDVPFGLHKHSVFLFTTKLSTGKNVKECLHLHIQKFSNL